MKDKVKTVVFRRWKGKDGGVIALFPGIDEGGAAFARPMSVWGSMERQDISTSLPEHVRQNRVNIRTCSRNWVGLGIMSGRSGLKGRRNHDDVERHAGADSSD